MITRFLLGLVLGTLFCAAMTTAGDNPPQQDGWPQWRGPNRNGHSAATGLLDQWEGTPPQLLWQSEGLGRGYASVSIAGERIYTTGNFSDGQSVVAADVTDGRVLWRTSITDRSPRHGYEGSRSTPTIDGDRLYVVASSGRIVCLAAADGKIVWSKDFQQEWKGRMMSGWGFAESPLVDGPWVLCTPGGDEAMVVALDKMTGEQVWASPAPEFAGDAQGRDGAGYSSLVVSHGAGVKQYVQVIGRGVLGVRAADGQLLWSYNDVANRTANIPTPIVTGDYVFTSTGYGAGAALLHLVKDGEGVKADEVYFLSGDKFQNHHGGMVLVGEYLYAGHGHNNGFPVCLEFATGKIVWGGNQRGPGRGSAAVVYADGDVIFRYQTGEVALIEATPEEYRLKGVFTPAYQEDKSWAHPVVVGQRLYLREQDQLMCYDLSAQ